MNNINIAFIFGLSKQLTGASIAAMETVFYLQKISAKVTIFSTHKPYYPWIIDDNFKINVLPWIKLKRSKKISEKSDPYFLRNIISTVKSKLEDVIVRSNYDINDYNLSVVNSIGSHKLWINSNFSKLDNSVLIVRECPNLFLLDQNKEDIESTINKISKYKFIIYASQSAKEQWSSYSKLRKKKSYIITFSVNEKTVLPYLNINKKDYSAIRKKLDIPLGKFIVVCVGNVKYIKGQDILFDNIENFINIIPNFMLYIIGRINSYWAKKQIERIENSPFKDYVKIMGEKINSFDYIYASDTLILPSRTDTSPRVVKEAMLLKTPIVASNVDGVPELVENYKGGILFDPNDPLDLLNALSYLKLNPITVQKFSEFSYKKYWDKFSTDKIIYKIREVFNDILVSC